MLWKYIRIFRSLPALQHLVIFLTTFAIPVSFELIQGWQNTGLCPSCVNVGKLTLYFGWYQIAMLIIASATRRDRAKVEARLDQISSELTDIINQLREENQGQMTGIQDRVSDLREWVQNIDSVMRDELGVVLPPPSTSLRFSARAGDPTVSVSVQSVSSSTDWRVRLLLWIKRQAGKLRRWTLKIFVDWEEG